ncbi:MAG TPA: SIMPL domain-containing protein [Gemmatimonadaceae bacterium]
MADQSLARAVILAVGVALGGWAAGQGFVRARTGDRFVTVKGISEREVSADLAIWPLRLVVADNELSRAQDRLEANVSEIYRFLGRNQIDSSQVSLQDYGVVDAFANEYRPAGGVTNRYIIRQVVVVRSMQPDRVLAASQRVGELVSAGVVLSSGSEFGGGGPTFVYRGLNDLKPEMIAEATARAREAAEQFAADARSGLGGIRRANQGVFEILPRDQARGISEESQITKTVRVVSTVEFVLR